jgi:hypothetical protein
MGVVAAMLVTASAAFADGVNLAWQNCVTLLGTANRTFACASNSGSSAMIGTFVLPNDVAQCNGVEVVVDLISQQATLPDWWALKFTGACRQNSLSIAAYNGDGTDCTDWAQGQASMNIASYVISGQDIPPGGLGPNTARIKIVNAVQPIALQDLIGTTEYGVFSLALNNQKSVGLGACAGCANPVCIVFNSCKVTTAGNLNNTFLGTGTGAGTNIITWQGAGADCQAVPVKAATWGQVKALYR